MNMETNEAFELGRERGFCITTWIDTPEIGTELPKDIDWQGIGKIETENDQRDAIQLIALECESNDRQVSPFESTAHDFNEAENSEELWEAFDEGISQGILEEISNRFD